MKEVIEEVVFHGTSICQGIAIGRLAVIEEEPVEIYETLLDMDDVENEVVRYRQAVKRSCEDLEKLQRQLTHEAVMEGAAILDTHLQIVQDPELTSKIEYNIRETLRNAEFVFTRVIQETETRFESLSDPFFRERSKDVQDVSRRVMGYLKERPRLSLDKLPNGSIVVVQELTASDVAEASSNKVIGFITHHGGPTSHASIMARAKGIPCLTNLDYSVMKTFNQCPVIIDGINGILIFNPTKATLEQYRTKSEELTYHGQNFNGIGTYESETYDGYKIRLSANIDMDHELDLLHQYGGNGVGLFRSESIFITYQFIPNEVEQYNTYRKIVTKMAGLPIVIRAFDIGGDKNLRFLPAPEEMNPFLGCRAIRFLLKEKAIFKTQMRAILRAAVHGNVSIMFPMISSLSELREAKAVLKEAQNELKSEGVAQPNQMRVGCMIEVPSAAIISDLLAKECDFLSIGTNDLVQYSLAVDRGNNALSSFYNPAHPGIIRLIKMVVNEANKQGIPVTVCGEIAADPKFIPLLLGLGVHELSVASRFIPIVKQAIRSTSIVEASLLAEKSMDVTDRACP